MKQAVLYVDSREAALKESGDILLSGVSVLVAHIPSFLSPPLPCGLLQTWQQSRPSLCVCVWGSQPSNISQSFLTPFYVMGPFRW